mmetsp:Transcript_33620/g.61938  ORF Transcript_33620/g.61938 Transcript_33620/m.61938 type:complete len:85 (-) Transcript_33620:2057-2311(-)
MVVKRVEISSLAQEDDVSSLIYAYCWKFFWGVGASASPIYIVFSMQDLTSLCRCPQEAIQNVPTIVCAGQRDYDSCFISHLNQL